MTRRVTHPVAALWIYTALRVLVFAVLLGLLWLFGLRGLLGAVVALALSLPLSYVLLARPRARLAASLEDRLDRRRVERDDLESRLSGEAPPHDDPPRG